MKPYKKNSTIELGNIIVSRDLLMGNLSKIATRLNIDKSTVSKTINGKRKNPETIDRIGNAVLHLFHHSIKFKSSSARNTAHNKKTNIKVLL